MKIELGPLINHLEKFFRPSPMIQEIGVTAAQTDEGVEIVTIVVKIKPVEKRSSTDLFEAPGQVEWGWDK